MKKFLCLFLALGLCLSLCACGKDENVKNVEEMIASIGEVTDENFEVVEAALDAYNELPEDKRDSVENYDVLENAVQKMFYIEFGNLADRLNEVYDSCQNVTSATRTIWSNVGSSDFWTCYNCVRKFVLDLSKAEYDELFVEASGVKATASIGCAAMGLCPDYIVNKSVVNADAVIDECVAFNASYSLIYENMEQLSTDIRTFKNKYKNTFGDEVDILNELCLEISLYRDFAIEPSGSLNNYISTESEYQSSIDRMIKTLDSYR